MQDDKKVMVLVIPIPIHKDVTMSLIHAVRNTIKKMVLFKSAIKIFKNNMIKLNHTCYILNFLFYKFQTKYKI